ncbi:Hypothetical predicted protein [Olea europaea subsp. europaea]|uniref:Uncharacterized protein n=1 Tax=Olea europaea subsp. europaea TaxID=158383 RepID=A0A8S0SK09_OLEEU|nr:Hypothetical predicted protein [Olea europaea subsp. europaea]
MGGSQFFYRDSKIFKKKEEDKKRPTQRTKGGRILRPRLVSPSSPNSFSLSLPQAPFSVDAQPHPHRRTQTEQRRAELKPAHPVPPISALRNPSHAVDDFSPPVTVQRPIHHSMRSDAREMGFLSA